MPHSAHDAPDWQVNKNPAIAEYSRKQNEKYGKLRDAEGKVAAAKLPDDIDLDGYEEPNLLEAADAEHALEDGVVPQVLERGTKAGEWNRKAEERVEISERTAEELEGKEITIEALEASEEDILDGAIEVSMDSSSKLLKKVKSGALKAWDAFKALTLADDLKEIYTTNKELKQGKYDEEIKDVAGDAALGMLLNMLDLPANLWKAGKEILNTRKGDRAIEAMAKEEEEGAKDYSPEGIRRQEAERVATEYEALYEEKSKGQQMADFVENFAKGGWDVLKNLPEGVAKFAWFGIQDMGIESIKGSAGLLTAMKDSLLEWAENNEHNKTADAVEITVDKYNRAIDSLKNFFTSAQEKEARRNTRISRAKDNRHQHVIMWGLMDGRKATDALRTNPEARKAFGDAQDALEKLQTIAAEERQENQKAA